jgi:polysaccharide export outer membrane protein
MTMDHGARAALFLAAVLLAGCASAPTMNRTPMVVDQYYIAPPDMLEITIRPEPAITRTVVVRPDGRISVDLIGDVEVEGKTVEEVRALITKEVAHYILNPDVTVILSSSNSRVFFVFGEVARPGTYPLTGHVTAVEALGIASGATRWANLGQGRLVRPTDEAPQAFRVDFKAITQSGDGRTNYELAPGDVIFLPPTAWARFGYALQAIFFPFQQVLGLGRSIVVTPGA